MPPSPRRLLLYALCAALLASVAVLACRYATRAVLTHQQRAIIHRAETRQAAEPAARQVFDSAYYFREGERYEVARLLDSLDHHAEKLPVLRPLAELPHGL